jgi:phospholipase/carboxylesterase
MSGLVYRERAPVGAPAGLLVLHHGRGTDEHDLLALGDVLDPERRLHVVTPGAPLQLPGAPGRHWYLVPRVGHPDAETFHAAYAGLAAFHDALWERTGIDAAHTVLGGFSMGAVMSYALGLAHERPTPAGILALSGFIPTIAGWEPDIAGNRGLPVLVEHGRRDPVIVVDFARAAVERLRAGGVDVEYHESDMGHHIDPRLLATTEAWLRRVSDGAGAVER